MEIHARMRRQRIIIPTDGKEGEVFDTDFSLTSDDAVPMRFRGDSSRQSTDKNYTQADIDIMVTIVAPRIYTLRICDVWEPLM